MRTLTEMNLPPDGQRGFKTTDWKTVEGAKAGNEIDREELVRRYWYPLYAYLRRQGQPREEAQDLIQQFFANLCQLGDLGGPDASRGHFRTFLLNALQNLACSHWRKTRNTEKRGRSIVFVSCDAPDVEGRYALEPADLADPAKLYERAWARQLLQEAREKLRAEWTRAGQGDYFALLEPSLEVEKTSLSYLRIAQRRGVTEGAIKKAVHDLRRAFRRAIREILRQERGGSSRPDEEETDLREFYEALVQ